MSNVTTEPGAVLGESGQSCPNCQAWRRLCDDYFIEKCPNPDCGDGEIYIFETDEAELPSPKQDSVREVADKIAAKFLRERWSKPLLTDAIEAALRDRDRRALRLIDEHQASDKCETNCWTAIKEAIRKE